MQITQSNYIILPIRAAAILTNSYVAATVLGGTTQQFSTLENLQVNNQLMLYVAFTIGSLTDMQIKIEFSNDGTTYYQETSDELAGTTGVVTQHLSVHKFAASGNYRIAVPIMDKYIKVSAIGTGTLTSSSLQIDAIVGNN